MTPLPSPPDPGPPTARPRVVAYVGNFRHPWCTEVHAANALEQLGCTVLRLQEASGGTAGLRWPDLARIVDRDGAELVIWQRTWPQDRGQVLAALEDLRRRRVPAVSYHLDRWLGLERERELVDSPFFRTDLVISPDGTPTERWAQLDIRHRWLPPGVAAEELGIGERVEEWAHLEAVFVGSYPYPHAEWAPVRAAAIEAFRAAFGDRFAVLPGPGRPAIRGKALADLYATVPVVLGDSCLIGSPAGYWSDRVPETLGRGGLLLHPWAGDTMAEWYRGGDHLNYYVDAAEAVDLARYYLAATDERDRVTTRAAELVASRDTYAHRLAEVLRIVDEDLTPRAAAPVRREVSTTFAGNARAAGRFLVDDRPGVAEAVAEVWRANDYRLEVQHVRGGIVIDVGANVGAFSVLAAKLGAAAVHAYEPDPTNYALLLENTRQAEGAVTCWPIAVAPAGVPAVAMHFAGGGAWSSPVRTPDEAQAAIELGGYIAQADTLADVILRHCPGDEETIEPPFTPAERAARAAALAAGEEWVDPLGDARRVAVKLGEVHLVKIDIEGGEYPTLGHLDRRVLRRVRRIVLEFHGPAMPHLRHLAEHLPDELAAMSDVYAQGSAEPQRDRWGRLVALLASEGRLEVLGRPDVGGLVWWDRYDDPEPDWRAQEVAR